MSENQEHIRFRQVLTEKAPFEVEILDNIMWEKKLSCWYLNKARYRYVVKQATYDDFIDYEVELDLIGLDFKIVDFYVVCDYEIKPGIQNELFEGRKIRIGSPILKSHTKHVFKSSPAT